MPDKPEEIIRSVVDACADCDVCRHLMDTNCQMFPELYRLYDKEKEEGEEITCEELRQLVDLCNFCALCPCPNIRADVIKAKTQYIDREGLPFGLRALEDVGRLAKICGTAPRLANRLLQRKPTAAVAKAVIGIHPERRLPHFPQQNFDQWMKTRAPLARKSAARKVAYFAGCTGRYLFPEVPQAFVTVLERSGVAVHYPPQECCGMPSMLEGDRELTLRLVRANIESLTEVAKSGYDIVCSCPTCGYFFKAILKEGAYYSSEYQQSVGNDEAHLKIPAAGHGSGSAESGFVLLKKTIYQSILKDDGYFSAFKPQERIMVAEKVFDAGEYLLQLQREGLLGNRLGAVPASVVYYPPCHLREQEIGQPYSELLRLIPGLSVEDVDWSLYCCGMAGIMGFKESFHQPSTKLGHALIEKIRELKPAKIITDCLSCRLQFNQLLPYEVRHPVELLKEAFDKYDAVKG